VRKIVCDPLPFHTEQRALRRCFTLLLQGPKLTPVKNKTPFRSVAALATLAMMWFCASSGAPAQQPGAVPEAKAPELPAQIGLLDTRIRVEANGDWRKEVHTRIHIKNELGVRQFSRLNFDYNRAYQQIEIPSVHITHVSGGTADILPSATTDQVNPAVVDAPAYQDVRIKSVRILGLAPGDALEYTVITTTSHGPLAPNFYLSHDFATEGLALTELFTVDLPASRAVKPWTSPRAQAFEMEKSAEGSEARAIYRWRVLEKKADSGESKESEAATSATRDSASSAIDSDIVLTSFTNWAELARALQESLAANATPGADVKAKAVELTHDAPTAEDKLRALYDFVSQKIATVDLPLGATGFRLHSPSEILKGKSAIPEEKSGLLCALVRSLGLDARLSMAAPGVRPQHGPAIPAQLTNALVVVRSSTKTFWLDPSVEVAPFGVISSSLRGKPALQVPPGADGRTFENVPKGLPFAASQRVSVDASIVADGSLHAKVHYTLRGENELVLRVAFHQSAREKWKDVAQLMSLSDGFRGKIVSASASDPSDTRHAFSVDYEITQPKFVDWSKQPIRIPAILPLLGLPDPPGKTADGTASGPIDLGTPLNVDTKLTLHLPPNVSIEGPTGTSVERDYATFASHYAAEGSVIFASRHINFILREVPAARAADYSAFLHAVQTDQAQVFTLVPSGTATKVATSKP
jgi:Domain of Unknown Function with PDB structure (DUF3857)/Transglutaminase-like superfamily